MSGALLPAGGDVCPAVMPAPFELGQDITDNAVCCANYVNPPAQVHTCRFLPGQEAEVSSPHSCFGE